MVRRPDPGGRVVPESKPELDPYLFKDVEPYLIILVANDLILSVGSDILPQFSV
jgi:hypothetical protein